MTTFVVVFLIIFFAFVSIWNFKRTTRNKGAGKRIRCCLNGVLSLSVCIALVGVLSFLRAFTVLTEGVPVASIETQRLGDQVFVLGYTPVSPNAGTKQFELSGDQWMVSGGFVKWHPWLTMLGVPSYHTPLRIEGRYRSIEHQKTRQQTVYILSPLAEQLWQAVEWSAQRLPFIDAIYGTAAFVDFKPGRQQTVFVSPTGYFIRESR